MGEHPSSAPITGPATELEPLRVSITLLGKTDEVTGFKWRREFSHIFQVPDYPVLSVYVERPHVLTLKFPNRDPIEVFSKHTAVNHQSELVRNVTFIPQDQVSRFLDTIAYAERLMKLWGATPTEQTAKDMAEWKSNGDIPPELFKRYRGNATFDPKVESKVLMQFEIVGAEEGWYVSVTMHLNREESKKLRELPAPKPATQPVEDK